MGSYSPTPEPEILPPGAQLPPSQQQAVRRPRPGWATAPATYLLVGINCAVFLAMVASGVSIGSPTTEQLMHFGANNAGSVLINGEWWRIVSAMFVHVGILHLATNMWCLWNLGLLAEPLMGSAGVLAVYILTGAAGNLLSTFAGWAKYGHDWAGYHAAGGLDMAAVFPPGAGASGAVFGIAGALIVLLKSNRLPVPPFELKKLRKSVIYFAALNLVLGFSINVGTRFIGSGLNIDNYAHMGGFGCGLLFAAPMVPRLGSPRLVFQTRLRVAVGLVVGVLVLFGFYLTKFVG
jgi:rhomboid protease GluP